MKRQNPSRLRRGVLIAVTALTLVWLYLVIGGLTDTLFFAKGYGEPAAVLATLVFVPFVVPAALLAYFGRLVPLAAALAGIAGFLYSLDPLFRLTNVLDEVPAVGVFAAGLVALLAAAALLARRKRPA